MEINLDELVRQEDGLQEALAKKQGWSDNERDAFRQGFRHGRELLAQEVWAEMQRIFQIQSEGVESVCLACGASVTGIVTECPYCGAEYGCVLNDSELWSES